MAENNNTENSNIAEILQAIINGSSDYPDFKDNPPSRIALLLMLLGEDISNIKEIVENLPNPMVFKGTLGTGGDIESLPAPSEDNNGFTYIVITSGTYAQQPAKFGDLFTSTGTSWSYVPSGDDYVIDDTVTSTALTWSSKKISDECKIKSFTYTGNGQTTNTINFPSDWKLLIHIEGMGSGGNDVVALNDIVNGFTPYIIVAYFKNGTLGLTGNNVFEISNMTNTTLTYTAANAGLAFNESGSTYTVYYI